METYVIPYVTVEVPWWVGLDIYNHNTDTSQTTIQFQRKNGTIIRTINESITGFYHYTTGDIPSDTITIIITGSQFLLITAFQGITIDGKLVSTSKLDVHVETNLKN